MSAKCLGQLWINCRDDFCQTTSMWTEVKPGVLQSSISPLCNSPCVTLSLTPMTQHDKAVIVPTIDWL